MEQFILDQVTYGLKYLPVNLAKSFFIKQSSEETKKLRKDFILGVCHPNENYKLIREANIGWIRIDIPYPYDKDGNISPHYESFKARCKGYVDNGIKVMAVTPYPQPFIENGLDPRCAENEEGIREVARFLAKDLQGLVGAFQVTNEMGIPRFTIPLKMDEAARFIAIQLEALYPVKGDILIGYNSAGPQADLHTKLRDYHKYCDYVGVDIYLGCFYGQVPYSEFAPVTYKTLDGACIIVSARSHHSGGVNAGLCDGSVRFCSDTINLNTWMALSTADGGETAAQ